MNLASLLPFYKQMSTGLGYSTRYSPLRLPANQSLLGPYLLDRSRYLNGSFLRIVVHYEQVAIRLVGERRWLNQLEDRPI